MSEKTAIHPLPKGYFPIRITVATGLAARFIEAASQKHRLAIVQQPHPATRHPNLSTSDQREEAVLAVPFPDKEQLRVDFNIFAAEMETEHGVKTEFLMESAAEFLHEDVPNATTIKATGDVRNGKTFKASSTDDLFKQILG